MAKKTTLQSLAKDKSKPASITRTYYKGPETEAEKEALRKKAVKLWKNKKGLERALSKHIQEEYDKKYPRKKPAKKKATKRKSAKPKTFLDGLF